MVWERKKINNTQKQKKKKNAHQRLDNVMGQVVLCSSTAFKP